MIEDPGGEKLDWVILSFKHECPALQLVLKMVAEPSLLSVRKATVCEVWN